MRQRYNIWATDLFFLKKQFRPNPHGQSHEFEAEKCSIRLVLSEQFNFHQAIHETQAKVNPKTCNIFRQHAQKTQLLTKT